MDRFEIEGGTRLEGEVTVKGAKNAALPIMAAALLASGTSRIQGVPRLRDVRTMTEILEVLGAKVERAEDGTLEITPETEEPYEAPYRLVSEMRGSFCVLGPLLAKRKRARVSLPGGCVIGVRPIDLHLKGMAALGAGLRLREGYVNAEAPRLKGAEIYLGGPFGSTTLGTCNVMMAACLAQGTTVIECAACEPEIVDLAAFLTKMGARIDGVGSHRIVIRGVEELHPAEHRIIPDRIEAGTFMAAAALTHGDVTVKGICVGHLTAVIDRFRAMGALVETTADRCRVRATGGLAATNVVALPYPAVPTDVQAQLSAVLAAAHGVSCVTDKVFPDRFMHVAELARMGVDIRKESSTAIIQGKQPFMGAEVTASDLRGSAALVLAGMAAEGDSIVHRVYHLDRGYEDFENRLNGLGARIRRTQEEPKGSAPRDSDV